MTESFIRRRVAPRRRPHLVWMHRVGMSVGVVLMDAMDAPPDRGRA